MSNYLEKINGSDKWQPPLKLRAHQVESLYRMQGRNYYALFHDMGCLTGDVMIRVSRAGKGFQLPISELWEKFNSISGRWDENIKTYARSFNGEHIILNEIDQVIDSGKKECFELKLENGLSIKATKDHPVLTHKGFVELCKLRKGTAVAVDLTTKHSKKEHKRSRTKPRYNLITVGQFHPYKQQYSRGKFHRIEKHRAIFEAFENKISLVEFQEKTKIKSSAKQLKYINPKKFHIHHIDRNSKNNAICNLQKLTISDHRKLHSKENFKNLGHGQITWIKVSSKKRIGIRQTYDISMASEPRNYVANHIVVHNTGKTCASVTAFIYRCIVDKKVPYTLILGPDSVVENWYRECRKIMPEKLFKRVQKLDAKTWQKKVQQLKTPEKKVFITNIPTMRSKVWPHLKTIPFDCLILDESHNCKTPGAKQTVNITHIADRAKIKWLLTGTPTPNDAMDLWAQFRIMDSKLLGANFYGFRAKYFIDRNSGMPQHKYFPNWQPRKDAYNQLSAIIKNNSYRVTKEEALDLPPFLFKEVYSELTPTQHKYYNEMYKHFVAQIEDTELVAEIALTKLLRLQQIVLGIIPLDDSGENYKIIETAKINALKETLDGIDRKEKVLIWSCFRQTYSQIEKVCDDLKLKSVKLIGGLKKDEKQKNLDSFMNDKYIRVCIANQQAAGTGTDGLQIASYAIYYSKNFNWGLDAQSQDRIHRGGSEIHKSVTRIDILTQDTVEEEIHEALKNKASLSEMLLNIKNKIKKTK